MAVVKMPVQEFDELYGPGSAGRDGWVMGGPLDSKELEGKGDWWPNGANEHHHQQFYYSDNNTWISGRPDGKPGVVMGGSGVGQYVWWADSVSELLVLLRLGAL